MDEFHVNQVVQIQDETYKFLHRPWQEEFLFTIGSGAEATVYLLARERDQKRYALKVFNDLRKHESLYEAQKMLSRFADIPHLSVLQERCLIFPETDPIAYQSLGSNTAVLMPFMDGVQWASYFEDLTEITHRQGLSLARQVVQTLRAMERRGAAHCDIAGDNVLITGEHETVEFIDLDFFYAPGVSAPPGKPKGKPGYNFIPTSSTADQWQREGDRFAGAILMCEMLCFHHPKIRLLRDGDHFFSADELRAAGSARFREMLTVLESLYPGAAQLFQRAWRAKTLQACPSFAEWAKVLGIDDCQEIKAAWEEHLKLDDDLRLIELARQFRRENCKLTREQVSRLQFAHRRQAAVNRFYCALESEDDAAIVASFQPELIEKHLNEARRQRLELAQRRLAAYPVLKRAIQQDDDVLICSYYDAALFSGWLQPREMTRVQQALARRKAAKTFLENARGGKMEEASQIYQSAALNQVTDWIPEKDQLRFTAWQHQQQSPSIVEDTEALYPEMSGSPQPGPASPPEVPVEQKEPFLTTEKKGFLHRAVQAVKSGNRGLMKHLLRRNPANNYQPTRQQAQDLQARPDSQRNDKS